MELSQIEYEVDPGVIEKLLEELPEKALMLGIRVLLAALVFFIGVQCIRVVRKVLKRALERGKAEVSAIHFMDSLVKFGLYFVLIFMIASGFGVDATSILAVLGSAGVAIGLALQGCLSNLAGGVLLLILKPFGVGDYIEDGMGNAGTVATIDIFYTHLTTPDNKIIVLPNGTLANGTITNYTECELRRIDIPVGISYDADIKKAKEVLEKVLLEEEGVRKDKEILVYVDALAESSVTLGVRCWAMQADFWSTKWHLTEEIKYALDEAGIEIPFPQLDVSIKK